MFIFLFIIEAIHKAGKHMEDHLVAAYSAQFVGHILMMTDYGDCHEKIESVRSQLKDGSFKYMAHIIRKFLVFMKMMVS